MYTLSKDILGASPDFRANNDNKTKGRGKTAEKIMHFLEQTEEIYFILTTKYEMANKKTTTMFQKLLPLNTPNVHKGLT